MIRKFKIIGPVNSRDFAWPTWNDAMGMKELRNQIVVVEERNILFDFREDQYFFKTGGWDQWTIALRWCEEIPNKFDESLLGDV